MVKRFIILIFFFIAMIFVFKTAHSFFEVTGEQIIAINQVEPSDATAVAMRSLGYIRAIINIVLTTILFAGTWFIYGKKVADKLKEE